MPMNDEQMTSYTSQEVKQLPSETDWERLQSMSAAEREANAQDDPDTIIISEAWLQKAKLVKPKKKAIHAKFDEDVIEFFKQGGRGYQTRMNAVLRAYMEAHQQP